MNTQKNKKSVSGKSFAGKVFYPEVIPDTHEKDSQRSLENWNRLVDKQDEAKRHYENLIQQRVSDSENTRYVDAINTIIEWVNAGKRTVPYSFFNFHLAEWQLFKAFLGKLKTAGCLEGWSTNPFKDALHEEYIFGTINIPLLQQFRDKEKIVQSKTNDKKFPYKLPAGTKWEQIIIKFLGDEKVFIKARQFKCNTNHNEMGFKGKGNKPSVLWAFLKVLSKLNGEITIKDPERKDVYKKQKELLTKFLQSYFNIDYDLFFPYKSSSYKHGDSYKIRITLIPPPDDLNEVTSSFTSDEEFDKQLKECYEENTPSVFEKTSN